MKSRRQSQTHLTTMLMLVLVLLPGQGNTSEFTEWLELFLEQPRFENASVGIHVVKLKDGQELFSHNSRKLLKPASCAKLFSGALFLHTFGPDHRFETPVLALKTGRTDLVRGLAVSGRGDVSMGARFFDWDYSMGLESVIRAVLDAGIRVIDGPIIGEDLYFVNSTFGTAWTWDDLQYYYGAPVSSLVNDDNVVDLTIRPGSSIGSPCEIVGQPAPLTLDLVNRTRTVDKGEPRRMDVSRDLNSSRVVITGSLPVGESAETEAVSVPDPAQWFAARLESALRARGVETRGKSTVRLQGPSLMTEPEWSEIARVPSFPVHVMLEKMMKRSQNLYAHTFLLLAGRNRADHDRFRSTQSAGLKALEEFTGSIGIPAGEMQLDEGSGLSRSALVSPAAITRLLRHMHGHPHRDAFLASLPVAGEDGTLRSRLRWPSTRGRIFAKTGSINHVKCLSGFLHRPDGEILVFSIMLNAYIEELAPVSGKDSIDTILKHLMEDGI